MCVYYIYVLYGMYITSVRAIKTGASELCAIYNTRYTTCHGVIIITLVPR